MADDFLGPYAGNWEAGMIPPGALPPAHREPEHDHLNQDRGGGDRPIEGVEEFWGLVQESGPRIADVDGLTPERIRAAIGERRRELQGQLDAIARHVGNLDRMAAWLDREMQRCGWDQSGGAAAQAPLPGEAPPAGGHDRNLSPDNLQLSAEQRQDQQMVLDLTEAVLALRQGLLAGGDGTDDIWLNMNNADNDNNNTNGNNNNDNEGGAPPDSNNVPDPYVVLHQAAVAAHESQTREEYDAAMQAYADLIAEPEQHKAEEAAPVPPEPEEFNAGQGLYAGEEDMPSLPLDPEIQAQVDRVLGFA